MNKIMDTEHPHLPQPPVDPALPALTPLEQEVLTALTTIGTWVKPYALGGRSGSHHSSTLSKLVKRGLVERRKIGQGLRRNKYEYRVVASPAGDTPESPLPCPFCGAPDPKVEFNDALSYAVFCHGCGARGAAIKLPSSWSSEHKLTAEEVCRELALKSWNLRLPVLPDHHLRENLWLRRAGCRCQNPLNGFRPGVGPRCRLCNTQASLGMLKDEAEIKQFKQDWGVE